MSPELIVFAFLSSWIAVMVVYLGIVSFIDWLAWRRYWRNHAERNGQDEHRRRD